jgi:non-ribosomal peptide synthetase component F
MRFDALVADLKRTTTTVFGLQAYPGADLAADLGFPPRPLFREIFALQPDRRGLRLGTASCQRFGVTTGTSKADLAFLVFPNENSLEGLCEYRTALFSPARIASFVASWQSLLEQALEVPATTLGELPLLSAETREQVDRWSGRARAHADLPETLPDLVERWAHATPDRVAARDSTGRSVTYDQLWSTSGKVACALQRRGVRCGSRVGYGVERSADTPSLLLGILRAGAAYVPVTLSGRLFQQDALQTAALDLCRRDLSRRRRSVSRLPR